MRFNVSTTAAILGLSLYLFGIAFAPITTPHLTERLGRSTVYMISLPLFSLFILGAGLSRNFASLAICRFFAGFFGGPCLVLIEGTFADVWSADYTITYYAMLSLASYVGAAAGRHTIVGPGRALLIRSLCRTCDRRLRRRSQRLAVVPVGRPDARPRSIPSRYWDSRNLPTIHRGPKSETTWCPPQPRSSPERCHHHRHASSHSFHTPQNARQRTHRRHDQSLPRL